MPDNAATEVATGLTARETAALLSLPRRDPGGMSEEQWWAYYSLLSLGLLQSAGNFLMVPTPFGEVVRHELLGLANADLAESRGLPGTES
jgi:hypothetical protein